MYIKGRVHNTRVVVKGLKFFDSFDSDVPYKLLLEDSIQDVNSRCIARENERIGLASLSRDPRNSTRWNASRGNVVTEM